LGPLRYKHVEGLSSRHLYHTGREPLSTFDNQVKNAYSKISKRVCSQYARMIDSSKDYYFDCVDSCVSPIVEISQLFPNYLQRKSKKKNNKNKNKNKEINNDNNNNDNNNDNKVKSQSSNLIKNERQRSFNNNLNGLRRHRRYPRTHMHSTYHSHRCFNEKSGNTSDTSDSSSSKISESDEESKENVMNSPSISKMEEIGKMDENEEKQAETDDNFISTKHINNNDPTMTNFPKSMSNINNTNLKGLNDDTTNVLNENNNNNGNNNNNNNNDNKEPSIWKDLRRAIGRWLLYLTGILFPGLIYYYMKYKREFSEHRLPGDLSQNPLPLRSYIFSSILPNRTLSRVMRPLMERELPYILRKPLYKLWGMIYHVEWGEFKTDITEYASFRDFFTRKLEYPRTMENSLLVSPVDGTVLTFGEIDVRSHGNDSTLNQIKGVPYNLKQFLGGHLPKMTNPNENNLYYCIIYLGPGDYHRFHSGCHWECKDVYHIVGDLYPVKPSWLEIIPGLFSLNERVILRGTWKNWKFNERTNRMDQESLFFSYTPVGAFNVGSIHLNFDTEIATNLKHHDSDIWYKNRELINSKYGINRSLSMPLLNINNNNKNNKYNINDRHSIYDKNGYNKELFVNNVTSKSAVNLNTLKEYDDTSSNTSSNSSDSRSEINLNEIDEDNDSSSNLSESESDFEGEDGREEEKEENQEPKIEKIQKIIEREPPYGKEYFQSPSVRDYYLEYEPKVQLEKGQEMGYFSFGSTIVLVFESKDFNFTVNEGQKIKFGNSLGDRQYY